MFKTFMKAALRFKKDECGAAMVEYAVALLVVTGIGIGVMTTLGTTAGVKVQDACTGLNGGAACTAPVAPG
ncbi:Flp family type IVb pilin [Pseudogemmobacter sp. W21_MBD1_M6]|uniref:Flp family type IVb pilin n=1 Tax=Pseudogemmobacter sp. W21_MBD1_M6 TaxID=3240271 RepID=UPI003F95E380